MSALLRLEQVVLWRGGRQLFGGLDLEVGGGEAVWVSGPNGVGKSSLLRLAAGLLRPDSGRIERGSLAFADDMIALDPELPLGRALAFWARLTGSGEQVEAALDAMGLADLAGVPVRLLSAGQARRAALARVVASPARLWLLDEPANGLDSESRERLDRMIDRHRDRGGAVVAASHLPMAGSWRRLELGASPAA